MNIVKINNRLLTYIDYDKELAEYFNCSVEEVVKDRKKVNFDKEWQMKVKDSKTANKFYAQTFSNLFRQAQQREKRLVLYRRILKNILETQYNYELDMSFSEHEYNGKMFSNYTMQNVLDYGCGIGDIGLMMAMIGYNVNLLEIGESELEKFIKWRFEKRNLPYNFIPYKQQLKLGVYDIVICIDVLEHHEDPKIALLDMYDSLRRFGYLFLEYGWEERIEYAKQLGGLDIDDKFIKKFIKEKFIIKDKDSFWLIKK